MLGKTSVSMMVLLVLHQVWKRNVRNRAWALLLCLLERLSYAYWRGYHMPKDKRSRNDYDNDSYTM